MFQALLAKIARGLDRGGVPYMVIGGQAVLLHGQPRLTRDIDITLGVDASQLSKVRAVVEGIGLTPLLEDVEAFVRKTNVLPTSDRASGIRVDLIFSFTPYETGAIGRAVAVVMEGMPVRFASVEDLIIHKLVAGRPRDVEDVAGILARKPRLDEEYLIRHLRSFGQVTGKDNVSDFKGLKKSLEEPGGD